MEFFGLIVEKVGECLGGYFCIIKIGFCCSDVVEMVMIEFVDYNEVYIVGKSEGGGCCCCCCGGFGKGKGVEIVVVVVIVVVVIFVVVIEEEE